MRVSNKPKKICYKCKINKNLTEFHKKITTKDGLNDMCKDCISSYHRQQKYNLNKQGLELILQKQNNKCLICKQRLTKYHIDHCHKTKKVRGLLCPHCNRGLGFFFDSKINLFKAILYLSKIPT